MRKCGYRSARRLQAQEQKLVEDERKRKAPKPLPTKRPRALTISSPPDHEDPSRKWYSFTKPAPQRTFPQSQSPFFAWLPSEIRQLIWTYAIGGHLLHIGRGTKKLLAIPCTEHDTGKPDELDTAEHGCWGVTSARPFFHEPPGFYLHARKDHASKPAKTLLSLSETCRRIYMETIPILYQENVFNFNHIDTIQYLQQTVLPQRLNQTRILQLTWDFNYCLNEDGSGRYDLGAWCEMCKIIAAAFEGLQEVVVRLDGSMYHAEPEPGRSFWKGVFGRMLKALAQVKVAKRFQVFVHWPERVCAEAKEEGRYPFELVTVHGRRGVLQALM